MTKQSHPGRWAVLWRAIVKWWRNEPPEPPPLPPTAELIEARRVMKEYSRLYAERIKIGPLRTSVTSQYAEMAAAEIDRSGIKRSPSLEAEVRVTAIAVTRVLDYLEDEIRYRVRKHQRGL